VTLPLRREDNTGLPSDQYCGFRKEADMARPRACHRVRAYVRIRFGRVEHVCAHSRCCGEGRFFN
jgi:hypothetical protein